MNQLLLGVDGGGSKTEAILARVINHDAWEELGTGIASGCNVSKQIQVGPIVSAIEEAFLNAKLPPCSVDSACFALAGCGSQAVADEARRQIDAANLAKKLTVVHDAYPLLAHVPEVEPAVALICGTGSLAWGRRGDREARSGGWGPLLGDEGSGYWMAMQAIKAVTLEADQRGAATSLTPRLLSQLKLTSVRELPPYASATERKDVAQLAAVVIDAATVGGDPVARQIVATAVEHLSALVDNVAQKLSTNDEPFSLAIAGGILTHHATLLEQLSTKLNLLGLTIHHQVTIPRPATGAVRLAMAKAEA